MGEIVFITGTDTGVGKTVLTALLLQHLRQQKIHALAMKPFCTGDRDDVKCLQALQPGEISDSEMNPFYFRQPVAPLVAARNSEKEVRLKDTIEKISMVKKRCDLLLVEGAGGVMVPLGINFLTKDLIARLNCRVVVVARNSLGTINHTLLSASALKDCVEERLAVVLMGQEKNDASIRSNQEIIAKFLFPDSVFLIPYLKNISAQAGGFSKHEKKIKKTLAAIIGYV